MARKILVDLSDIGLRYARRIAQHEETDVWALHGISFQLFEGESLGVIGRNGAGKSTLLRLLAGIIAPDEGTIRRFGGTASLLSLQVGFLPQLTGRDNAMMSGILLGLSPRDIKNKMDDLIRFADLEEAIDTPLKTYSHGMRARLGFAVAFLADPEILLIDEVLGVGDIDFKKKSSTLLKDRIRSHRTAVLVSHDISTVNELCDRVVWIEKGRLIDVGTTEAILEKYQAAA